MKLVVKRSGNNGMTKVCEFLGDSLHRITFCILSAMVMCGDRYDREKQGHSSFAIYRYHLFTCQHVFVPLAYKQCVFSFRQIGRIFGWKEIQTDDIRSNPRIHRSAFLCAMRYYTVSSLPFRFIRLICQNERPPLLADTF